MGKSLNCASFLCFRPFHHWPLQQSKLSRTLSDTFPVKKKLELCKFFMLSTLAMPNKVEQLPV
jgi:hypothetical protein